MIVGRDTRRLSGRGVVRGAVETVAENTVDGVTAPLLFAAMGLLMFGLNYVFAYRAQVHITSALAAITFSTMLWMNIILSRILFGTRAGARPGRS